MKGFFGVIFVLIAVLTGGCSVFFSLALVVDGGNVDHFMQVYLVFIALGFGTALITGLAARALLRRHSPAPNTPPDDPQAPAL